MPTLSTRRRLILAAGTLVVLVAASVWHIMRGSYRSVMHEFDSWRDPVLLEHPERTGIPGLQEVAFRSRDGFRLTAWYVPSHNRAAVVLVHGTNADRTTLLPELNILSEHGFGVLALDWPGHGNSEGTSRWDSKARNALTAAIDWLSARADVDPQRIGAYGFSIGGYLTTQVASYDSRLRAVVIAGTPRNFAAYVDRNHSNWGLLSRWPARMALENSGMPFNDLRPEDVVSSIAPRAILFLSGTEDVVVPTDLVEFLYGRAREPKEFWVVPHAAHGDYAQVAPEQYSKRLGKFFAAHLLD